MIKRNHLKFQTLYLPFAFLLEKILKLNGHPEYSGILFYLDKGIKGIKTVHSSLKNAKFRVCQSQVHYLRTTHLGPLKTLLHQPELTVITQK